MAKQTYKKHLNKNNNSNGSNKPKDDKVIIDAKIKDL